jgi:hypothetical protein
VSVLGCILWRDISFLGKIFHRKEFIFLIGDFLRNCQILSVFQKSFTSNSFRIRSCLDQDPKCFFPYLYPDLDPTGSESTTLVTRHGTVCGSVWILDTKDFD